MPPTPDDRLAAPALCAPRAPIWAVALVLIAGALQAAGHARLDLALGGLLAPALFLIAVDGSSVRRGAVLGALFGAVLAASFVAQAGAPWMVALALCCFALLCGGQGALLAWLLGPRRAPVLALLLLPLLAAIYELLNGWLSPLGDYLGLAPAVTGIPLLPELARLGGGPLAAAALIGLGTALGLLLQARRLPGRRLTSAIALCGWLLLISVAHISLPTAGRTLRVAAVALEDGRPRRLRPWQVAAALGELTDEAAGRGARLVVWPEAAIRLGDSARRSRASIEIEAAALRNGVVVVAGIFDRARNQNLAMLFGVSSGSAPYAKRHLIPGIERYSSGRAAPEAVPLPELDTWLSTLICFDDCFAGGTRTLADAGGTAILALPTNDWPEVAYRHLRLAPLRAAEGAFPVVRAAHGGFSALIDRRGRILASERSGPDHAVVLVGDLDLRPTGPLPELLSPSAR